MLCAPNGSGAASGGLIAAPDNAVKPAYGELRVLRAEQGDGVGKQALAGFVGDVEAACVADAVVDMDVGLAAVLIAGQHEQVAGPGRAQPLDGAHDDLQQLL